MIHIHDFKQCSPEWFRFRKNKLSASHATEIGANGAGLKTYCKNIVLQMTGTDEEQYSNAEIERGNRLEPIAINSYEMLYGVNITTVGSVTNDLYLNASCSPDGLIGTVGGVEIKARNNQKHLSLILGETKEIPFNQIQMSLMITERKWWDFVSINVDSIKPLFVKRIYPDLKYFEKLKKGIDSGNNLINDYLELYNSYTPEK